MERSITLLIFLILLCISTDVYAQKDSLKILKDQEGIIVFKLNICNPKNDEYCVVSHDIYIKKKRYSLANDHLLPKLERIINPDSSQTGKKQLSQVSAKRFRNAVTPVSGYKNLTGTNHFAFDILADGDDWRRNKGGDVFIHRQQEFFDHKTIYIAYKIKGNFALVGQQLSPLYSDLYDQYYQLKAKEPVHFPVTEVLSIHHFSGITAKEAKRIGIKPYKLEYYRLRTSGLEKLLDQTGKGKRDI